MASIPVQPSGPTVSQGRHIGPFPVVGELAHYSPGTTTPSGMLGPHFVIVLSFGDGTVYVCAVVSLPRRLHGLSSAIHADPPTGYQAEPSRPISLVYWSSQTQPGFHGPRDDKPWASESLRALGVFTEVFRLALFATLLPAIYSPPSVVVPTLQSATTARTFALADASTTGTSAEWKR